MKKLGLLLAVGLLLSACGAEKITEAVQVRTGTIMAKNGNEYVMNTDGGIINIASQKVDLEKYMKKEIEVKGMFSGSTLYVDEVK